MALLLISVLVLTLSDHQPHTHTFHQHYGEERLAMHMVQVGGSGMVMSRASFELGMPWWSCSSHKNNTVTRAHPPPLVENMRRHVGSPCTASRQSNRVWLDY